MTKQTAYVGNEEHDSSVEFASLIKHISPATIKTFEIEQTRVRERTIRWRIPIHSSTGECVGQVVRGVYRGRDCYVGNVRKENVVFNLNRVLAMTNYSGDLTITEDIYECIRLWQSGEHHIVALLGCKVSKAQICLLCDLLLPLRIRFIQSSVRVDLKIRSETIRDLASVAYVRVVAPPVR